MGDYSDFSFEGWLWVDASALERINFLTCFGDLPGQQNIELFWCTVKAMGLKLPRQKGDNPGYLSYPLVSEGTPVNEKGHMPVTFNVENCSMKNYSTILLAKILGSVAQEGTELWLKFEGGGDPWGFKITPGCVQCVKYDPSVVDGNILDMPEEA